MHQAEIAEKNACVEALFSHYRVNGFPVYDLSPRERAERLASLMAFDHSTILKNGVIRQTMHGVSLCWHYHPHMWDIRCGGKRTPMEVFLDDRLFKQALAKRLEIGQLCDRRRSPKDPRQFLRHTAGVHFQADCRRRHLQRIAPGQRRGHMGFLRRLRWTPSRCPRMSARKKIHRNGTSHDDVRGTPRNGGRTRPDVRTQNQRRTPSSRKRRLPARQELS